MATDTPESILEDYEFNGWKAEPMERTLRMIEERPETAVELVRQAMDWRVKNGTFIDTAVDLLDDVSFAKIAEEAWLRLKPGEESEVIGGILSQAALQKPEVFSSDWERLAAIYGHRAHDFGFYTVEFAWRALDQATIADWSEKVVALPSVDPRSSYVQALLRSRNPEAVRAAWEKCLAGNRKLDNAYLWQSGYAAEDKQVKPLHGDKPLHVCFSPNLWDHMFSDSPEWKRTIRRLHPTWARDVQPVAKGQIGGELGSKCGVCHQPLQRLICLPVPEEAGIACETALTLGTCFSCLGWETGGPAFYRHAIDGLPEAHPSQQHPSALEPNFQEEPLMEGEAELFHAPDRWAWQDWGMSNDRQNLNRIGGAPSWIQSADFPQCPDCSRTMKFIMQFDTGLLKSDGRELLWGSGGINYIFWCQGCRVSAHLWQCT